MMKMAQTNPQKPSPEPMAELYRLVGAAEEQRNQEWERVLLENAWQAVFLVPGLADGTAVSSLGGFPYMGLVMPRAGLDYTGFSLRSVAKVLLSKGVGASLYLSEGDQISQSFARISMGDIDTLYRNDIAGGDHEYKDAADVLRDYTARALHRQIKALFPTSNPKVTVALREGTSADVGLSLGMDIGRLTTDATEPLFAALEWCLPESVTFRLIDVSAEDETVRPLAEFF